MAPRTSHVQKTRRDWMYDKNRRPGWRLGARLKHGGEAVVRVDSGGCLMKEPGYGHCTLEGTPYFPQCYQETVTHCLYLGHIISLCWKLFNEPVQGTLRNTWVGREIRKWGQKRLHLQCFPVWENSPPSFLPGYGNIISRSGNNSSLRSYK